MDEHAGVAVAVGVDVEEPPPAGDTAAHILAVILEVHHKDGLGAAVLVPNLVINILPLLRRGQQIRGGVVAHRHIVEAPDEIGPHVDQLVDKFLRDDGIHVGAGVAGGDAEGQAALLQNLHGANDLLVHAVAPAAIGGLLEALQGDGRHKVLDPQHIIGKLLVDQGAVGEAQECAVVVLLAQANEILLPHHRLAAGVNVQIYAQLLALLNDIVDLVKGQVQLVAVLGGPAAGTVQVTGRGGVQQNGPGAVAAIFFPYLLLALPAHQVGVDKEVDENGFQHLVVHVFCHVHNQLIPVAGGVVDHLANDIPLQFEAVLAVPGEFVHPVHQLRKVFLRVFRQVVQRLIDCKG